MQELHLGRPKARQGGARRRNCIEKGLSVGLPVLGGPEMGGEGAATALMEVMIRMMSAAGILWPTRMLAKTPLIMP